jgi:hypothetical protein
MHFEESCFWTLSIVQAEPASETLFLKKKHWMMDKVQKQDSSEL